MIGIFDVDYRENSSAVLGGVIVKDLTDTKPLHEFVMGISHVADYEPGSFYERELPCLLQGLEYIQKNFDRVSINLVIIDGYVWLDANRKPGLGAKLFEALDEKAPVIGIAKSAFKDFDHAEKVYRGISKRPIYVTTAGMDTKEAANLVQSMSGKSRLPDMVKRADRLCREGLQT